MKNSISALLMRHLYSEMIPSKYIPEFLEVPITFIGEKMSLLFSSFNFKNFSLSSRLVMPPMASEHADKGGFVTKELCRYYNEKTQGGLIGLVITEHSFVSPEGRLSNMQLSIAEDSCIDGLKELAGIIHNNGSKVIAQINHAGGAARAAVTGLEAISASSINLSKNASAVPPKEMTEDDIDRIISAFAAAAYRAKKAGFDGAEIHSAHGYLLNQFYSPLVNKRSDEYTGKNIAGRIKLHLKIIKAVRDIAGKDFLIALRLGACDYTAGGSSLQDSVKACLLFEKAGVDILDISGGFTGYINPETSNEGWFCAVTEAVKDKVNIPVILTGGIVSAQAAENLLRAEKTDLIGVGRALLKNSLWAKEAKEFLIAV